MFNIATFNYVCLKAQSRSIHRTFDKKWVPYPAYSYTPAILQVPTVPDSRVNVSLAYRAHKPFYKTCKTYLSKSKALAMVDSCHQISSSLQIVHSWHVLFVA